MVQALPTASQFIKYQRMDPASLVEKVEVYLLDHMDQIIKPHTLASKFGLSYSTLLRHFHTIHRQTISQWYEEKKMICAALLLQNDANVRTVAALTGYTTPEGFRFTFKKYFNQTPGAYHAKFQSGFPLVQIQAFLLARLARDFDKEELKIAFPMDYNYLKLKFHQQTGKPIRQWFTIQRVEKARTLLTLGKSVRKVAEELGFTNDRALIEVFKRHVGSTPGAYYAGLSMDKLSDIGQPPILDNPFVFNTKIDLNRLPE